MSETIVADLGDRAVWRTSGPKGMAFFHDVLTADVDGLVAGQGAYAALLTDKGRIRAIVRVLVAEGGGAWIECDDGSIPGVEAGLVRIAPLGGVDMEREPRRLIRLVGAVPAGLEPGADEATHATIDGAIVVRTRWGGDGIDVLAEPDAAAAWIERLGAIAHAASADAAAAAALEEHRIRGVRPRYGVDVDDTTHVLETPLAPRWVSSTKGCYPGQESVAKIRNLGRVRRRLVALDAPGAHPGDAVIGESGEEAGRITSVAGSPAMAIVKTEAGALTVGGTPATILDPL